MTLDGTDWSFVWSISSERGGGLSGDYVEEVKQHDGQRVEVAEVEADLRDRHGRGTRRTSKSRWRSLQLIKLSCQHLWNGKETEDSLLWAPRKEEAGGAIPSFKLRPTKNSIQLKAGGSGRLVEGANLKGVIWG
jgi:hypothetical protein